MVDTSSISGISQASGFGNSDSDASASGNSNAFGFSDSGQDQSAGAFGRYGVHTSPNSGIETLSKQPTVSEQILGAQTALEKAAGRTSLDSFANSSTGAEELASHTNGSEEDNPSLGVTVGRAGAAGRESFIAHQAEKAYQVGFNTPKTDYSGALYRAVPSEPSTRVTSYGDFTFSDSGGRVNRFEQTVIYNSETVGGIRAEFANYSGLANQSVIKSDFNGSVVDVTESKSVRASALMESFGDNGQHRTLGSRITGEDPYTHPRALADGARAQGADAVRIPANDKHVNLNILPENTASMSSQYSYVEHTPYDSSANPVNTVFDPQVKLPPDSATPGQMASIANSTDGVITDKYQAALESDNKSHQRASGARYGAAGAGAFSAVNALRDGRIDGNDATNIAIDTAAGASAAVVTERLPLGGVKAGALVDGVVAVGASTWNNADLVESGEMSAGDATADVLVDTGVAVTAGVSGAAAGAAVGSVLPVVGTAVGAGVGFVVGAGAAYVANKTLEDWTGIADSSREKIGDILEDNFEKPLNTAWSKVDDAKDYVSDKAKSVSNFVGGLFGW